MFQLVSASPLGAVALDEGLHLRIRPQSSSADLEHRLGILDLALQLGALPPAAAATRGAEVAQVEVAQDVARGAHQLRPILITKY